MDDILPGTVLDGRYRITRLLSTGGMGRVYEAFHEVLQRRVAVKFLMSVTPQALKRFDRECQALKNIDHDAIPEIYSSGVTPDGVSFFVMEFCEGQTLQEILVQKNSLQPEIVCNLAIAIAECLSATHAAGIVHRDIKPSNIMVADAEGLKIKLLDFGIAHASTGDSGLTGTNEVLGSLAYFSPEHLMAKAVEPRSDLFSLGCVMYRSLSGTDAIDVSKGIAGILKVSERKPLSQSIPEFLRTATNKCLALKIEERFSSADALVEVLRAQTICAVVPEPRRNLVALRAIMSVVFLALVALILFVAHRAAPSVMTETPTLSPPLHVSDLPKDLDQVVPYAFSHFKDNALRVVRSRIFELESAETEEVVVSALKLRNALATYLAGIGSLREGEKEALELVKKCNYGRASGTALAHLILPSARGLIVEIRLKEKRFDEALGMVRVTESAANMSTTQPQLRGRLNALAGEAYWRVGDYEKAKKHFERSSQDFDEAGQNFPGYLDDKIRSLELFAKCAQDNRDAQAVNMCQIAINQTKLVRYMKVNFASAAMNTAAIKEMEAVYAANTSYLHAGSTLQEYIALAAVAGKLGTGYAAENDTQASNRWFLKEFQIVKVHLPPDRSFPGLVDSVSGLGANGYTPLAPYGISAMEVAVGLAKAGLLTEVLLPLHFRTACHRAVLEKSPRSMELAHLIASSVEQYLKNPELTGDQILILSNFAAAIDRDVGEYTRSKAILSQVREKLKSKSFTKNSADYAEFLHSQAATCRGLHQSEEALQFAKDAYGICSDKSLHIQSIACLHLADAYMQRNNDEQALLYLSKTNDACKKSFSEKGTDSKDILGTMVMAEKCRAALYLKRGDISAARKVLQQQELLWKQYQYEPIAAADFRALISKADNARRR